eukprot:768100-Hanusia_phi.AAC.2
MSRIVGANVARSARMADMFQQADQDAKQMLSMRCGRTALHENVSSSIRSVRQQSGMRAKRSKLCRTRIMEAERETEQAGAAQELIMRRKQKIKELYQAEYDRFSEELKEQGLKSSFLSHSLLLILCIGERFFTDVIDHATEDAQIPLPNAPPQHQVLHIDLPWTPMFRAEACNLLLGIAIAWLSEAVSPGILTPLVSKVHVLCPPVQRAMNHFALFRVAICRGSLAGLSLAYPLPQVHVAVAGVILAPHG